MYANKNKLYQYIQIHKLISMYHGKTILIAKENTNV